VLGVICGRPLGKRFRREIAMAVFRHMFGLRGGQGPLAMMMSDSSGVRKQSRELCALDADLDFRDLGGWTFRRSSRRRRARQTFITSSSMI